MPDADNVLARCKAFLDGVCDALGVDDGSLDCLGVRRVHFRDHADNPRVGVLTPGVRIGFFCG